ncbi:hypothetical protein [Piscirickettsia salmonis]
MTQKEASRKEGVPVDTIRKMINNGEIKNVRIKGRAFIPADQFEIVEC